MYTFNIAANAILLASHILTYIEYFRCSVVYMRLLCGNVDKVWWSTLQLQLVHELLIEMQTGINDRLRQWMAWFRWHGGTMNQVRTLSHCTAVLSCCLLGMWAAHTLHTYLICLLLLNCVTSILRVGTVTTKIGFYVENYTTLVEGLSVRPNFWWQTVKRSLYILTVWSVAGSFPWPDRDSMQTRGNGTTHWISRQCHVNLSCSHTGYGWNTARCT